MRVLLHCIYFPPERGGLESHVGYLARGLAERGCRVEVVTSRSLPGVPSREERDGVAVRRTWFPSRSPVGWGLFTAASTPATLAAARRADVVHAQAFPSIVPGALSRWVHRIPLVATLHTSHFLTRAGLRRWRPVLARLVRSPDQVLAASQEIAQVAQELSSGREVEALPNGVDTRVFRRTIPSLPPGDGPRLVVPRRLVQKNGVEYLVRGLPELVRAFPGIEVLVIGDGPERGRLEALARELGVSETLRFLGSVPHEEMPGLLSSARLAVIPSLMEATSVAALEAMACELPVAASRVGGLPEIVGEETGALFSPGDPDELAGTVARLLRAPDLEGKGRRARELVEERWSNDRLVDRHMEIYREVVERSAPSRRRDALGSPSGSTSVGEERRGRNVGS